MIKKYEGTAARMMRDSDKTTGIVRNRNIGNCSVGVGYSGTTTEQFTKRLLETLQDIDFFERGVPPLKNEKQI